MTRKARGPRPSFKATNAQSRAEMLAKSVRRLKKPVNKEDLTAAMGRCINLEGVSATRIASAVDSAFKKIPKIDPAIHANSSGNSIIYHNPGRGRPRLNA